MSDNIAEEVLGRMRDYGVVPVVSIGQSDDSIPLGNALLEGGIPCVEITFRTAAAEESLKKLSSELSDILLGAGTVLTRDQARRAVAAGAKFIVSPGFDEKVVSWCLENKVVVFPGVATPTEINLALDQGLSILKFFPAEALGGVKMLKAISAPYGGVKFIPTGGVNLENLADYLRLPSVHACGGSWLVKRSLIDAGDFGEITRRVKEALEVVRQVRAGGYGS
jgi:2-dehydro-3-deoxyphosphogluconate aldolase/(4S)-4-hydroxy-2-oxoglutarate aldolase